MNTQRIRVLLAAIECGSLTRAGEELGYTQSALTQMVRSFEEEVGFPLLNKTTRGVTATPEAEQLLPTMRLILSDEEKLDQEISAICGIYRGRIRLGSFESTSAHWLPLVLKYFRSNYPDVVFQIEEYGHDELLQGLLSGTLDMALMSDPGTDKVDFIPIYEDPLYVAFAPGHELSEYDKVPLKKLRDQPFIVESKDRDTYNVFARAGFEPDVRYYSKDSYAILSMAEQGLGIAVLPGLIIERFPGSYEYRPLDPGMSRLLGIGVRNIKRSGPLARFIIKYIQDNIG